MSDYMTKEQAIEIYGEKVAKVRKELNDLYGGNTFNYEYVARYMRDWEKNTREILEKAKKGYELHE